MFTANKTLTAFDALFTALEKISEVDIVKFGESVINTAIIIIATIHAVISYASTAVRLWWLDNGDAVMTNLTRFTFISIDTIGAVYYAGVNSRPTINHWVSQLMDRVYFTAIAL